MNNEWSYVLNTDDIVQGVHIEKCVYVKYIHCLYKRN